MPPRRARTRGATSGGLGLCQPSPATTMTRAGILNLSVELLVEILSYLDYDGLLHCRQVSLQPGHDIVSIPRDL